MKATRRGFLVTTTAAVGADPVGAAGLDTLAIARRHPIERTQPTPDFFEGILLGNGDIGVCVTVRPDALGLHIGKSDVWDIRVSEDHVEHIKPFADVLKLWREAGERAKQQGRPEATFLESNDPEFRKYAVLTQSSYRKPWPRPWPCGIVWLHWDSRMVRVVKQSLDIATGVLAIEVEHDNLRGVAKKVTLRCFVSREEGHVLVESDGPAPVVSAAYAPYWDAESLMPQPELKCEGAGFECKQLLPATAPKGNETSLVRSAEDRVFALCGRLAGQWKAEAVDTRRRRAMLRSAAEQPLRLDVTLFTSLENPAPEEHARKECARLAAAPAAQLRKESERHWAGFWKKSAVEFADKELEKIWYRNQYFLACCLKPGKIAPGLFGNWSSGKIGTAWHGDYHMNYNTQQVWWGVFASNHVEQHEPYTRLVESLMPMAEWNAKVQFGLPGAYFPHSAYPVPSKVNPYPAPPWGYEICETPWTVQSLWWEYKYTLDEGYLRRVYPMMRAAAEFVVAFVKKGGDGKYHIEPTVSPENWGATVDFRLNKDCIIDIALTEFLLDAMLEGSRVLGVDGDKRAQWEEVRRNLAPYPTVDGPHGRVWLDILNAPAEWVYNVPVTISPVFPAEQVGLGRREEMLEIARRTTKTVRLEGGNDLVWQPLTRARLAMLDFEWFKREVRYSMTPLGVANDRVRQIDGRYRDETNFDFMMRMGVWTENLSLPAVLNECLMQSYTGVIRLFPNRQGLGWVEFRDLRAMGAFLVSAAWDGKRVTRVSLRSEKGARARIVNPWSGSRVTVNDRSVEERNGVIEFDTQPGADYRIIAARQ